MKRLGMGIFVGMTAMAAPSAPDFTKILSTLNVPTAEKPYYSPTQDDLQKTYQVEISNEIRRLPPKTKKLERNTALGKYVREKNETLFKKLKMPGDAGVPDVAQRVYKQLAENKVSRIDTVSKYDDNGEIGFCFGRAVMAHYLLLENKIPQDHIAKVFAIGQLKYGRGFWNFHMATLYETEKEWWVIDTVAGKVLSLSDWTTFVSAMDPRQPSQVRFYVTDPRKFQPSYGTYRKEEFEIPDLKRYFVDLFATLAK